MSQPGPGTHVASVSDEPMKHTEHGNPWGSELEAGTLRPQMWLILVRPLAVLAVLAVGCQDEILLYSWLKPFRRELEEEPPLNQA